MRVAKKMPYKKCKMIPSVDCGVVLKKVPDLLCYPEVVEDCKNEVKEVPFIDKENKCELLIFEECRIVRFESLLVKVVNFLFDRLKKRFQLRFAREKDWIQKKSF